MTRRTVEIPLTSAQRLSHVLHGCVIDAVTRLAREDLDDAIAASERATIAERLHGGETVPIGDVLALPDDELEAIFTEPPAPSGEAPRPQWANVAKATRIIEQIVASDPAYVGRADALGAYVRDTWDALGLSLYDEQTLYVALVMAGMLVEMANNGREKGQTTADVVEAIAKIGQSFTAAVLPYLPPEARA